MTYSVINDWYNGNNLLIDQFSEVLLIIVKGLYIHYPFCKHLCNYCDFYKFKYDQEKSDEFESFLIKNIDYLNNNKFDFSQLQSIYFGGGTPSLWKSGLSKALKDLIKVLKVNESKLKEITMEVDPDTWSEDEVEEWIQAGVNRFSIGVQAFDEKVLRKLDRRHTLGDIEKTLKFFNERGLNYSVDILLGAPVEKRNLEKELNDILAFEPKHFSTYILKTRSNYVHKADLPSDDGAVSDYEKIYSLLKNNDYKHYEVSNFAKNGFESLHNNSYWSLDNVLAIGPNATGFYQDEKKYIRYQVAAHSGDFKEELLSEESYKLEKVYLGLRTEKGINPSLFFSKDQWQKMDEVLVRWSKDALLESSEYNDLRLSSAGFLLLDSFIDEFFRYSLL